jgi:aryl-alcohol dehydrogenase-like predicted oxidoreductase
VEKRKLGRSGLDIAPLVFGGNVFGWTVDEKTAFRLLDNFVGAGFNCIDTADVYSVWVPGHDGGESETIIGRWLQRRGGRHNIIIATKVGAPMGDGRKGLSRANISRAAEASLGRLQTDYIDLYQSHIDDAAAPLEETLRAYSDLLEQGKIRAIGASNYNAARLHQALETSGRLGLPRYDSLQPRYNLYDRSGFEGELEALCAQEALGVICYAALASGFLTGKYRSDADLSKSPRGASAKPYLDRRGGCILEALDAASRRFGATPAQVSLAWLMAQPTVTAPIASATSVAQLEELVAATRIKLDGDALALLNHASLLEVS